MVAEILLKDFLSLYELEKDFSIWESFENQDTPRGVRLKRIKSVMKALDISLPIKSFLEGSFLIEKEMIKEEKLGRLLSGIDEGILEFYKTFENDKHGLANLFKSVLKLRLSMHDVMCFGNNIYAASDLYVIPILIADEVKGALMDKIVKLDELLVAFINLENRLLSQKDLENDFDFPKVDLDELDLDFL